MNVMRVNYILWGISLRSLTFIPPLTLNLAIYVRLLVLHYHAVIRE